MSHAAPTVFVREWSKLAPKLVAFLATGLSASALVAVVDQFAAAFGWGWTISPTLATQIVLLVSTIAGWWYHDPTLGLLPPTVLAPKLVTLALSSGVVSIVLAILTSAGIGIPAGVAGLLTALLPTIPGYLKNDYRTAA